MEKAGLFPLGHNLDTAYIANTYVYEPKLSTFPREPQKM